MGGLGIVALLAVGALQDVVVAGWPTRQQVQWHDCEVGMFIHFAPNAWQDQEYDGRTTPLADINPAQLDTEQWVDVAESMGAKYIVFVAKHVGGFCMWQTDTTQYGIRNTPWRGGKGDVLGDLAESCRKRGMKLGVYLSPRDDTLGADTGGKCKTPEAQEKYNAIYRQQLTEILTRYGEIFEVWFDGGNIIEVGDVLRQHAPKAVIFQGKYASLRWVGNEDGTAPYPAWNKVSKEAWQRGATAADGDPNGDIWLPNECDARIRADWFWNSKNAKTLKSLDRLMTMYYQSVGRGAVLLLNQTPDTTGRIPEADARRAAEFGAEIKRRFGTPIAETRGEGDTLELALPEPQTIDHVVLMEDIAKGERVLEYVVETWQGGEWKPLCGGSAIGHKKIDQIKPVRAEKIRFRCTKSNEQPIIRSLAVFNTTR